MWVPHRFLKIQVITYLQGEGKEREEEGGEWEGEGGGGHEGKKEG